MLFLWGCYMFQTVTITWHAIDHENMPSEEGTYLVVFDDGAVETYPMSERDIVSADIRDGYSKALLWAECIKSPI